MAASMRACVSSFAFVSSFRSHHHLKTVKRWYARSTRRRPLASLSPEEDAMRMKAMGITAQDPRKNPYIPFIPNDPTQTQFVPKAASGHSKPKQTEHKAQKQQMPTTTTKEVQPRLPGKTGKRENSELQYEKLEEGDKRFGRILFEAKSRKERGKKGIIMLEGRRLILDSLHAGAKLKYLYFTDISMVEGISPENLKEAKLYKVQRHHLKLWTDTVTPAGVVGIFAKPADGEVLLPQTDTLPMTLICDNVRDPGNMGALIRTAAAAGCQRILATKGCVDVWDPKVLRSAMGSHFYICILNNLTWENISNYISSSTGICIADARKECLVQKQFDPKFPGVDSLIASESSIEEDESSDLDGDSSSEETHGESESSVDEKKWTREKDNLYKRLPLHVIEYSQLECRHTDGAALIVGGETEGVSSQAKKFAFDRFGQYVTIPMIQAANSLNVATAAAIVLYEIRRKLVPCFPPKRKDGTI